jgi:hypothetical protein
MIMKAVLVGVGRYHPSDFGMSNEEFQHLISFEGTTVTVDCEAVDGYYDITLRDGTEVAAVSEIHLKR